MNKVYAAAYYKAGAPKLLYVEAPGDFQAEKKASGLIKEQDGIFASLTQVPPDKILETFFKNNPQTTMTVFPVRDQTFFALVNSEGEIYDRDAVTLQDETIAGLATKAVQYMSVVGQWPPVFGISPIDPSQSPKKSTAPEPEA